MTDDRNKSSQGGESVARPTARDVPFVRGAGSESEPAPPGQRPAQLPRDPTYEAELAEVELAVLRDPQPRDDPSTKQGGRRAQQASALQSPHSVTPESPAIRVNREGLVRSPEPPSSEGRSVASGTLLSVGAVDPRGKTERTLETPRMFISQQQGSEAYFKPGKIPAVTVHQTLETETVKLSDSIDPRRAKTIPRLDRAALARLAELEEVPDSESGYAQSEQPSSLDVTSAQSPHWNQEQWDAEDESLRSAADGQIHASLSPFRDQPASSFSLEGVATRPEPLAARRSDLPAAPVSTTPDTSTVPTQRDLPAHRIEASQPPPAPPGSVAPRSDWQSLDRKSEGPTTASIMAEEPEQRPVWINYAAFSVALLLAVVVGLYLTRGSGEQAVPPPAPPSEVERSAPVELERPERLPAPVPAPVSTPTAVEAVDKAPAVVVPSRPRTNTPAVSSKPQKAAPAVPPEPAAAPLAPEPAAEPPAPPKSSNPKTPRETIF
jgi:hypothetical protein